MGSRSPSADFYPVLLNTLTSALFQDDYYDYHAARGWWLILNPVDRFNLGLNITLSRARHRSLAAVNGWSVADREGIPRMNPAVTWEGATWTRFGGTLRIGRPESSASVATGRGISIGVEHGRVSEPALAVPSGERSYVRVDGVCSWSIPTFTTRYLFSPMLVIRLAGGVSDGLLPRELWRGPENALGVYAPLGSLRGSGHREFAGTDYAVLTVEHNFRSQPFQLLGLRPLYERGIELLAHAGVAQTWQHGGRVPADGPYREIGFGIGRIADFLRIDLTRRLTRSAGWYLTLTLTTFL